MPQKFSEEVPESIALPSDPDDQSREREVTVVFEWTPGQEPSGLSGPPENYDPGSGDEFYILSSGPLGGDQLPDEVEERLVNWLIENWTPPEPEHPEEDGPEWEDF